ncbi:Reticulocyte-binding protein 2 a [Madurella mycetomatis]|uniref:Reticulocyte-binding protein 2 a n=1 Tax=Madurella mycetomatis TaxID=100816 RepID=A0A175W631_9PEZI|nr:Reticulocyte-binding protein 2 a [Madurella mycetomatis]
MAPTEILHDYYAILEVTETASEAEIRSNYKRLAKIRHPDKNGNNPDATAQFQLLQAAYTTLIEPASRHFYNFHHYPSIRPKRKDTTNAGGNPTSTSCAAEEPGDSAGDTGDAQKYACEIQRLDQKDKELRQEKSELSGRLFELKRALQRCIAALDKLQEEAEKDEQEDAARNTRYGHFFGAALSAEEKEAKSRRTTERNTGRIVREAELKRFQASADKIQSRIDDLRVEIIQTVVDRLLAERAQAREQARQKQAAREAAAQRARQEKESARRREEGPAKREAEAERRREQDLREYLERVRKEAAARKAKATEEMRKKEKARKEYLKRQEAEKEAKKQREVENKRKQDEDLKGDLEQKEPPAKGNGTGKEEEHPPAKPESIRCGHGKNWGAVRILST